MKRLITSLLLMGFAGFVWPSMVGCASRAARPLPPSSWDGGAHPAPERVPYLVTVFQRMGWFSVGIGCGAIVHSCREHGTYVLTAFHVVNESRKAGVWVYGYSRSDPRPEEDEDKLLCFDAERIYPELEDFRGVPGREFFEGMRDIHLIFTRDFAILKLRTSQIFHTAPIHPGDEMALAPGSPVELGAVPPENYPHLHPNSWQARYPEEVVQSGHSGGPILYNGAIFAIIASTLSDSRIAWQRPTVGKMRNHLKEERLEFIFSGDPCRGASSGSRLGASLGGVSDRGR